MKIIKAVALTVLAIISALMLALILFIMINWARSAPACYHHGGCNYGSTTSALQKGELS